MIYEEEEEGNGNGSSARSTTTTDTLPPRHREPKRRRRRRRRSRTLTSPNVVVIIVVVVVIGVLFPFGAESLSFPSCSSSSFRHRRGRVPLAPSGEETNQKKNPRRGRGRGSFASQHFVSQNPVDTSKNPKDDDEKETSSATTDPSFTTTTPTRTFFSSFQFAPNGVCIQPQYFEDISASKSSSSSKSPSLFTMRNVPGDGDCMFLAVALAAATSMGVGGNDALLRAISRETRHVVAQVLESPHGILYIRGKKDDNNKKEDYPKTCCLARDLLRQATQQEGFGTNTTRYLQALRTEGRQGGLYGGGPELTVLANVLRRPISIYEILLLAQGIQDDDDDNDNDNDNNTMICPIVCRGTFGDGLFEDPCLQLENSAVLLPDESKPDGAYSWHLHILVVDVVDGGGEKHACVLLPASSSSSMTTTTTTSTSTKKE